MIRKTLTILIVALVVAFAASPAIAQGLEREFTILMGEMYFQVEGEQQNAPIELEAGAPYRITFENVGDMVHRVKFGRGVVAEEGSPYAYVEDLFSYTRVRVIGTSGEQQFAVDTDFLGELDLEPGATVEMVFTLTNDKQGEWEIGCFVPSTATTPNHWMAGMRAPLNVR